jgi:hypothetical protein
MIDTSGTFGDKCIAGIRRRGEIYVLIFNGDDSLVDVKASIADWLRNPSLSFTATDAIYMVKAVALVRTSKRNSRFVERS